MSIWSDITGQFTPTSVVSLVRHGWSICSEIYRQSPVMVVVQDENIILQLGKINKKLFYQGRPLGKNMKVSDEQPTIADNDKIESGFYGAPTLVTVFAPKKFPYAVEDGTLVLGNMMLAANSLGIGSCFIARATQTFETDEGKEIIRDEYTAIGFCILGYPDSDPPKDKPRKEYVVKRIN